MMQNDMMQANKSEDMGWEFVDDTLTNAQHTVVFVTPRGRRYHARSSCSDATRACLTCANGEVN